MDGADISDELRVSYGLSTDDGSADEVEEEEEEAAAGMKQQQPASEERLPGASDPTEEKQQLSLQP